MLYLNDFFPPDIHALFTERDVDFSFCKEKEPLSSLQHRYLDSSLPFSTQNLVTVQQVHGQHIVVHSQDKALAGVAQADGCLTGLRKCWLSIRTADCLPVYLCDPVQKCIGLIHAGWQGTRQGIVSHAVSLMTEIFQSHPKNILVLFGPGIRTCCYEVGSEFSRIFPGHVFAKEGRLAFDLAGANRGQLVQAGIRPRNIRDCRLCTCCDPRFFSYRREGAGCGRHLALMAIG